VKDVSQRIYENFLGELDGLDRFRQRFQERNPSVPLEREDPDVRRLLEAMAYFSVRTRHALTRNLRSTWRRMFASFFDYLLEPIPASGMIQALPSQKMTEAIVLARGTEVRLKPADDEAGTGFFRLQRDLRVLPIYLERAEVPPEGEGDGWRLKLDFRSYGLRKDPVDILSLYVRHLDAYRPSLGVFHELRHYLRQVTVRYGTPAGPGEPEAECQVSFSRDAGAPDDAVLYAPPLQKVRAFFQFPEQELFLHVKVPPSRKEWDRFSLTFDLDKDWRQGRSRYPEFLHPFVVPVVNLKKESAQLITMDGTRSEYPIRSRSAGREFSLHSVTEVNELTKAGSTPLRPALLPGAGPSYEIEETFDDSLHSYQSLIVRMPEAFTAPKKILVEALWYQPRFMPQDTGRIGVTLPGRHIEGLHWQMMGEVHRHSESPLGNDVEALTQVMAWKTKPTLKLIELKALLSHLGTPKESPLRLVIPLLSGLKVSTVPDGALRGSGVQHAYEVQLAEFDPSLDPLVVCFLAQVRELLDVWNGEATVALKATVEGRTEPLVIGQP
jgi:type VI secretion system protein ImpG